MYPETRTSLVRFSFKVSLSCCISFVLSYSCLPGRRIKVLRCIQKFIAYYRYYGRSISSYIFWRQCLSVGYVPFVLWVREVSPSPEKQRQCDIPILRCPIPNPIILFYLHFVSACCLISSRLTTLSFTLSPCTIAPKCSFVCLVSGRQDLCLSVQFTCFCSLTSQVKHGRYWDYRDNF